MIGVGRTQSVSVHWFRRTARLEERRLQTCLEYGKPSGLPEWARGARVEKIGRFQYAVICTELRGH